MKLLVGLGNPGQGYEKNRHNVGFMALDYLQKSYNLAPFSIKDGGAFSTGLIGSYKVTLLKPLKYMNASGPIVAKLANFYKIAPEEVFVFHDELDVHFGRVKAKIGGGAGGHNGLRSIDAHFANNTTRIRIGIDHPGHKDLVTGYVLGNFNKQELEELPNVFMAIDRHVPDLLEGNLDQFRTKVAQDL